MTTMMIKLNKSKIAALVEKHILAVFLKDFGGIVYIAGIRLTYPQPEKHADIFIFPISERDIKGASELIHTHYHIVVVAVAVKQLGRGFLLLRGRL